MFNNNVFYSDDGEIMQRLYPQNQQVLSESILQKLKEEEIFVNENCTLVSSSSVGQSESKNKTALLSGLALSPIKKKKISKFITNTLKEVNNKLLDIKGKLNNRYKVNVLVIDVYIYKDFLITIYGRIVIYLYIL